MKLRHSTRRLLSVSSLLAVSSTFSGPIATNTNANANANANANTARSFSSSFSSLFASAMAVSPSSKTSVRVASYNVLSSHLSGADHFSTLDPEHLLAANRLPVVLEKLDAEMEKSAILCLQEVSHDWAGSLHAHLANKGYHFVTGLYGKRFNGYMGVGIAVPTKDYEVLGVDISRLADTREGGWPRPPRGSEPGRIRAFASGLLGWGKTSARTFFSLFDLCEAHPRPPVDPWSMAQNRFNEMVTVTLGDRSTGRSFVIGNYHMPCAFYAPVVMTLHADLAARHVQRLAKEAGRAAACRETATTEPSGSLPCALVGDFNIKPDGSSYRLLTTGAMDACDPEWPPPRHGTEWAPGGAEPMRSAYAVHGGEPDFTNYARIKEQDPFVDTLDYIFLSEAWRVGSVKELPHREGSGGPFPNLDRGEPSDHILIAADLELD